MLGDAGQKPAPAAETSVCPTLWSTRCAITAAPQVERRIALGAGKLPVDAPVFPTIEGGLRAPSDASRAWGLVADGLGMPEITFHGLRHTTHRS